MDEIYRLTGSYKRSMERWIRLAHVCRRWRSVIFQAPRRLNLRLICTDTTPARETLDIWPPLPLIIEGYHDWMKSAADNINAALEHNDRVCQISLNYGQLEYATDLAAIHKPFTQLTSLAIIINGFPNPAPNLPDSFLGGTAPRLRDLHLSCVQFPGLPKLLLSATHLVHLQLYHILSSGYFPPEALATSLSVLTSLEFLRLEFVDPQPRPALESRRLPPPPLTRSILPSLTRLRFHGASEYLEEIFARIDALRLDELFITFFNEIIFDTPQLFQFISRRPALRAPEQGYIAFNSLAIAVRLISQTSESDDGAGVLGMRIPCTASDWQVSSLEQICTSSLPPVSTLEDLYILEDSFSRLRWQDNVENTRWLELLHPFAAVKNLYICKEFVPRIVPALKELVGGRTTDVLPTLQNIFLKGYQQSGPLHEGIEEFVAARQLTGHPVVVSHWDEDSKLEKEWQDEIYNWFRHYNLLWSF